VNGTSQFANPPPKKPFPRTRTRMLSRSNDLAAALSSPPNDPQTSPCHSYFGGRLRLRVPRDEAALQDIFKEAHRLVVQRRLRPESAEYDAALRAEVPRLLEQQPVFWSRLWPAGLALGKWLLAEPSLVASKCVLDIGAGLGPEGLCASLAGASDTVVTDIEAKALGFVKQSALDNGVESRLRTLPWNWNDPPPPQARGPFDVVLAGDVIYHTEHAPRLGELLVNGSLVKPGGFVIFSDSLERPYGENHQSELCARLRAAQFEEVVSRDIDVGADLEGASGVAGGRQVRLIVFSKPGGGPRSNRSTPRGRNRAG